MKKKKIYKLFLHEGILLVLESKCENTIRCSLMKTKNK